MKPDPDHPLFGRSGDGFRYWGSWSTRLGDCGFHTNHVHPRGWISSAYYVALPDAVRDEEDRQGWIKFGEPSFDAGFARSHPARRPTRAGAAGAVSILYVARHNAVPLHHLTHDDRVRCPPGDEKLKAAAVRRLRNIVAMMAKARL